MPTVIGTPHGVALQHPVRGFFPMTFDEPMTGGKSMSVWASPDFVDT
jgi:hypothetical protein